MTRRKIRVPRTLYNRPGAVFHVVIQTQRKKMIFINSRYARLIFRNILDKKFRSMVDLIAFVVMPDHLHLLFGIKKWGLIEVLHSWKTFTTNLLHRNDYTGKVWQRSYWDRGMRGEEDIVNTIKYIISNPTRLSITTEGTKYPFAWCLAGYEGD